MRFFAFPASFVLLTLSLQATAITNIESQRKRADQEGLKGELQLAINGKSGNSDKQSNALSGRLDYRKEAHQLLAIARSEYGESNNEKDVDNNFLHFRYIHHNTPRFAWESFVQYQDDAFKLLDSRQLVGGGARFDLSPGDEHFRLTVGAGAYYTEEVYNLDNGELRDDYARANFYVSYFQQLTATTQISNTLYWQPRFSRPSDSYVYNSLALSVKINQSLALQISLESQYDSQPVDNLEHTDHSYSTSLVYSF